MVHSFQRILQIIFSNSLHAFVFSPQNQYFVEPSFITLSIIGCVSTSSVHLQIDIFTHFYLPINFLVGF